MKLIHFRGLAYIGVIVVVGLVIATSVGNSPAHRIAPMRSACPKAVAVFHNTFPDLNPTPDECQPQGGRTLKVWRYNGSCDESIYFDVSAHGDPAFRRSYCE